MKIVDWLEENSLNYSFVEEFPDKIFEIKDVGYFLIIEPKQVQIEEEIQSHLFDQSFHLILDDIEQTLADIVQFFAFKFGGNWYFYNKDQEPQLNPLKYLGKAKSQL